MSIFYLPRNKCHKFHWNGDTVANKDFTWQNAEVYFRHILTKDCWFQQYFELKSLFAHQMQRVFHNTFFALNFTYAKLLNHT